MYPNPQDVLPLPPRPDVGHYRKRAKELVKAHRSGGDATAEWARRFVQGVPALQPDARDGATGRDADRIARLLASHATERLTHSERSLSQAQFVVARAHGFASWRSLVAHLTSLTSERSGVSAFERAADAIVHGDVATLDRLLASDRSLVRARSTRAHGATLLHYVSANGVENYRQRTPSSIVDIATRLLDAGAEVDAEADVYGGGATTLGLTVTSAHPRRAGVQRALADLLVARGARVDPRIVRSCLMNGCPEAAAHMANLVTARGVPLELEEAAGVGLLDLVATHFEPERRATPREAAHALITAAWYDRRDVVAYLLDHEVDVATRHPTDGETPLHVAAYSGHLALTSMLLARGAPVDARDGTYGTSPLVWALHAWLVDQREPDASYRAVLLLLADAGAEVRAQWIDDDRVRADAGLHAALAARLSSSST